MTQLTKNFNLAEFACKDGTPVPKELQANAMELAKNLQVLRDYINAPIHLSSAYRTPKHNAAVGGKDDSCHLKAMAGDISTKNHTPKQLKAIILKLIAEGKMKQGGIGLYKGFVHYDIRGWAARW